MNTVETDEYNSSVNSFSLVEDDPNKTVIESDTDESFHGEGYKLQAHLHLKEKNLREKLDASFESTSNDSPIVQQVTKVRYLDSFIRVYTCTISPTSVSRCFYHEPLVVLDRGSIVSESSELLKKDLVRFKIKMWDAEIRAKVLERLRSLPSLKNEDIHEDDVHVMPYEEVQLVAKPGSILKSIRLTDEATSYLQLNESLDFDFECDLPSVADALAENLKKNPELIVKKWKLALECRGLALDSGAGSVEMSSSKMLQKRPTWTFNLSTTIKSNTADGGCGKEIAELKSMIVSGNSLSNETCTKFQDLQDQIQAINNKRPSTSIPVFSVENCSNPKAAEKQFLGFSTYAMQAKTQHGDFDLSSGIFTVKTAGNYLINFNANVHIATNDTLTWRQFDLKINDETVVVSYNESASGGFHPAVISALLPLNTGDKLGIFAYSKLCQSSTFKTRFFGILLDETVSSDE